jgi:hypothetical protein
VAQIGAEPFEPGFKPGRELCRGLAVAARRSPVAAHAAPSGVEPGVAGDRVEH